MGYVVTFAFLLPQLLWFVMERKRMISPIVALGLVLITFGLTLWVLPYLTPVRLSGKADPKS